MTPAELEHADDCAYQIRALIRVLEVKAATQGRWRPVLLTAVFAGLRASELRGLRWSDVDLERREIRIHQRADRSNTIGQPKSVAGERVISIPGILVNTLREWKLACPRRDTGQKDADGRPAMVLDLVFANGAGKVESHANIVNRGLAPTWIAAGVTVTEPGADGKPVVKAKYTGLHSLRHFYASWCINPPAQGGIGLIPKAVQERLGHSTIQMTMDVYGHRFPRGDDKDVLAAAERELLG